MPKRIVLSDSLPYQRPAAGYPPAAGRFDRFVARQGDELELTDEEVVRFDALGATIDPEDLAELRERIVELGGTSPDLSTVNRWAAEPRQAREFLTNLEVAAAERRARAEVARAQANRAAGLLGGDDEELDDVTRRDLEGIDARGTATPAEAAALGGDDDGEPGEPLSIGPETLATMSVADVVAHVGQHPDELEGILALERASAKPRKGVLELGGEPEPGA